MSTSYEEFTFKDKNPIKRWLQMQRLVTAIKICDGLQNQPEQICDFGAGNGELCKLISEKYQHSKIVCYEPESRRLAEAKQNLSAVDRVEFLQNIDTIPEGTMDVVFCLEVFEHLPADETTQALGQIFSLLKPGGVVVVGVPVEIGVPALYKGVFRMSRRYGAFDANIRNVLQSFICKPPSDRPTVEMAPGFNLYPQHVGFNFLDLKKTLAKHFKLRKSVSSPFETFGSWIMPEVYFVAEKTSQNR